MPCLPALVLHFTPLSEITPVTFNNCNNNTLNHIRVAISRKQYQGSRVH